jgi:hypothetical protein
MGTQSTGMVKHAHWSTTLAPKMDENPVDFLEMLAKNYPFNPTNRYTDKVNIDAKSPKVVSAKMKRESL